MSIFGSIVSKIFHSAGATPPADQTAAADTPAAAAAAPAPAGPAPSTPAASGNPDTPAAPAPAAASAPPAGSVDVAAVLDGLVAKSGQPSNWRVSIVDLMKLLDLDYSLTARKELAHELHYTGSTDDSATMNIWLHKQVMTKLAANGGKVPDDLKV